MISLKKYIYLYTKVRLQNQLENSLNKIPVVNMAKDMFTFKRSPKEMQKKDKLRIKKHFFSLIKGAALREQAEKDKEIIMLRERFTEQESIIKTQEQSMEKLESDKRSIHANFIYERNSRLSEWTTMQQSHDADLQRINVELRCALDDTKDCRMMAKYYVELLDQKDNDIDQLKRYLQF